MKPFELMDAGLSFALYLVAAVASVLAVYYLISLVVGWFDNQRDDDWWGKW